MQNQNGLALPSQISVFSALGIMDDWEPNVIGPIFAYQRRTLRTTTLWVARKKPLYYELRDYKRHPHESHKDQPFFSYWKAEQAYWSRRKTDTSDDEWNGRDYMTAVIGNKEIPNCEITACYPATHWIHITLWLQALDKTRGKPTNTEKVVLHDIDDVNFHIYYPEDIPEHRLHREMQ